MPKALASSRKESPRDEHPARIRSVPLVQRKSPNGAENYSGEGVNLKSSAIITKSGKKQRPAELMRKHGEIGQLLAIRGCLSIEKHLRKKAILGKWLAYLLETLKPLE
jgi:hypothetical protein